jgi:hypothetical protein
MATVTAACLHAAAPAYATFHDMKIQEIFPGSTTYPNQAYVTLQMYSAGQNFVDGHTLTLYGADGTIDDTSQFVDDVDNGQNQSTILIGEAATVVGVAPDLVDSGLGLMDPAGGAVCWEVYDCVSWGTFTQPSPSGLPSPTGGEIESPGGIGDETADRRKTNVAGCDSMLETVDDRPDPDDWSGGSPAPRNNATPPSEKPCFDTEITKGPAGKTTDRTPTFRFKSVPVGATAFQCAIDDPQDSAFNTCTSPFTLPRQSLGRHKLYVRAANEVFAYDPTPAKQRFRVIRRN